MTVCRKLSLQTVNSLMRHEIPAVPCNGVFPKTICPPFPCPPVHPGIGAGKVTNVNVNVNINKKSGLSSNLLSATEAEALESAIRDAVTTAVQ